MRNFFLGVLVGIVFLLLLVPLLGLLVWAVGSGSRPSVPSSTVLLLHLNGGIPEFVEADLPDLLSFEDRSPTADLYTVTEAIRYAADDERVKALMIRGDGSWAGWAKAQEVRWAIQDFKESGKPIWAFLEVAGREDYYIASLADKVVMQPESYLDLKGLRMEIMFFKGTLDKLGIEADLIRTGKYKSAGEPFSRTDISPEWREVLESSLDEFYEQLLAGIAEGRGHDAEHWKGVLDAGPFTSSDARELGLVDDVLYIDAFRDQLSDAASIDDLNTRSVSRYAAMALPESRGAETVAILHANGPIISGSGYDPFTGTRSYLGSDTFIRQVNRLRENDNVAGVILRVDSPGGDAIASDQMLRAVRRLVEEKPVVVSMSNVAASGGYYIAAAPQVRIIAYPGTQTGSIGVFTMMLNLRQMYDKLGITKEILTRGRFAAIDSDYKPMTEPEREKLRSYVDAIYDTFLSRVAEARDEDVEAIHELAQGRVWMGTQALENGLVDELGGFRAAVAAVKDAAGIDEDDSVRIITYPQPRHVLEMIFSRGRDVAARQLLEVPIMGRFRETWANLEGWLAAARSGPLYMAPYTLSVE